MNIEKIITVKPRGFCAGVTRSIKVVEDCLKIFGVPVYVKHEIVHNKTVVSDLENKGMITVEEVSDIPEGAVAIFSAHGSPPEHFEEARKRNIQVIDATCPLVTKVHIEMIRYIKEGFKVIYIGHHGHVEGLGVLGMAEKIKKDVLKTVEEGLEILGVTKEKFKTKFKKEFFTVDGGKEVAGVLGEAKKIRMKIPVVDSIKDVENLEYSIDDKIAILTQTTLNIDKTKKIVDAIKEKYRNVIEPPAEDICYATTNRQNAVKELVKYADVVLVVGSKISSNSNRLAELARENGMDAYLIDEVGEIEKEWFEDKKVVGITSGASAPEYRVQEIVEYFMDQGVKHEELIFDEEDLNFTEPMELVKIKRETENC